MNAAVLEQIRLRGSPRRKLPFFVQYCANKGYPYYTQYQKRYYYRESRDPYKNKQDGKIQQNINRQTARGPPVPKTNHSMINSQPKETRPYLSQIKDAIKPTGSSKSKLPNAGFNPLKQLKLSERRNGLKADDDPDEPEDSLDDEEEEEYEEQGYQSEEQMVAFRKLEKSLKKYKTKLLSLQQVAESERNLIKSNLQKIEDYEKNKVKTALVLKEWKQKGTEIANLIESLQKKREPKRSGEDNSLQNMLAATSEKDKSLQNILAAKIENNTSKDDIFFTEDEWESV